jgi:hypothetical protein
MPQTFYIENDEEIISVIGRLRHSSSEENYFIFPKRSLVLQSIINLRLFQREAEKLGKKVIVVTQDETGKALAEKAGLATEHYTDDFSRKATHMEIVVPSEGEGEIKAKAVAPNVEQNAPRSEELGSSDFYAGGGQGGIHQEIRRTEVSPQAQAPQTLRVRNASPLQQTSLNSRRFIEEQVKKNEPSPAPRPIRAMMTPQYVPKEKEAVSSIGGTLTDNREERLKNFFSADRSAVMPKNAPVSRAQSAQPESRPRVAVGSKKVGGIFFLLGGVSLLSLIGVLLFLFLPKAEVQVIPYKTTQSVDLQFDGRSEGVLAEENILPVRLVEKEQEVVFTVNATGASLGTAQKAHGTVVISNRFSTEAQSLVATTRLEAPDGKIFRLVSGVVVPGMTNSQPGIIEASVIADQVGTGYNIPATTFTIPGFKGSPKYEKFSAQSSKAMSGGGDATGTDLRVISKEDLEKAESQAKEKAKETYLNAVKPELLSGERVLEENLDIVALGNMALPLSGTVATSFEYKNTFKVRGFIFSEDAIKQKILESGEQTLDGVTFRPTAITLSYGEAIPDYDAKKVRLKVHAVVESESVVDKDKLLNAILGKNTTEINDLLGSFPEIKKVEIVFKPQWFSSSIPTAKSRVIITVAPGSVE